VWIFAAYGAGLWQIRMLFARDIDSSSIPLAAPCALLLTESHSIPDGARDVSHAAAKEGFAAFIAPWFAVKQAEGHIYLTSGVEYLGKHYRPIADWFFVRPQVLMPLFPIDEGTEFHLRALSEAAPNAFISFDPTKTLDTPWRRNCGCRAIPTVFRPSSFSIECHAESEGIKGYCESTLVAWWKSQPHSENRHLNFDRRVILAANVHVNDNAGVANCDGIDFAVIPAGRSNNEKTAWQRRASAWFRAVRADLSRNAPAVLLPNAYEALTSKRGAASGTKKVVRWEQFFRDAERSKLRATLSMNLAEGESTTLSVRSPNSERSTDLSVTARKVSDTIVFDLACRDPRLLDRLEHPLASVFPALRSGHCYTETHFREDAEPVFLSADLRGPAFCSAEGSLNLTLQQYLARSVTASVSADRGAYGRRFVEPGVGRGYLVDCIRVEGRPELIDFNVIGIGLTPYSRGGYVNVGRKIDGKVALLRGLRRKRCAERLERIGCRAAPVLAIFRLRDDFIALGDRQRLEAALVVRGFRSVFRIKQLDPVACFYHSIQANPPLMSFVGDPRWDFEVERRPLSRAHVAERQAFLMALHRHGVAGVLPRTRSFGQNPNGSSDPDARALQRRFDITCSYAPLVLEVVKRRVAMELGRDPYKEPLTNFEYGVWFARTMGEQLARFRKHQFLHDYHQQGVSRHRPAWLYSLCENNITLLAEFPDLDTGIFLNGDRESLDELQLTKRDLAALSAGFEMAHLRDLRATRVALRTLSTIVCHGDRTSVQKILGYFDRSYDKSSG
jgi:hypothetical protein